MPTLLGIHGSVTPPGRLHQALRLALDSVVPDNPCVAATLLHLGDFSVSFADGRPPTDFPDDTGKLVDQVSSADMFLIATPIFRASYTGALKNLLDHLPVEALHGKVCGLIGMGGSDHHYLAVDTQLRPVLGWFGAVITPTTVYLQSRDFQDGQLASPQAAADLQSLASAVVAIHHALAGKPGSLGPRPLAG